MSEVQHGGNENRCVADERKPEFDFECIDCERTCCWCFGTGCEVDEQAGEGRGLCCDCWCDREARTETPSTS